MSQVVHSVNSSKSSVKNEHLFMHLRGLIMFFKVIKVTRGFTRLIITILIIPSLPHGCLRFPLIINKSEPKLFGTYYAQNYAHITRKTLINMHACTRAHTFNNIHIRTCTHIHTCTYIQHTHTRTHIHTHPYTYVCAHTLQVY